jgi:hypothetical protein
VDRDLVPDRKAETGSRLELPASGVCAIFSCCFLLLCLGFLVVPGTRFRSEVVLRLRISNASKANFRLPRIDVLEGGMILAVIFLFLFLVIPRTREDAYTRRVIKADEDL